MAQPLHLTDAQIIEIDRSTDFHADISRADLFLLVVSAKTGISQEMISTWQYAAERQIPRMILVNGLEMTETDFDDIVLIANRVLEQVITPYLVLHDEVGEPVGLISLHDNKVHDYSSGELLSYDADSELQSLVAEFKTELEESTLEFDESSFREGIVVPALPISISGNIGVIEFKEYLDLITRR